LGAKRLTADGIAFANLRGLNIIQNLFFHPGFSIIRVRHTVFNGCKSRLLFAKIAMTIWFQVSGFRKHVQ